MGAGGKMVVPRREEYRRLEVLIPVLLSLKDPLQQQSGNYSC